MAVQIEAGPSVQRHLVTLPEYERMVDAAVFAREGNAIRLPQSNSRPQPDLTLLRWRDDFYAGKRPLPENVLLLVETSDSSLKLDRGSKLKLYAEAGIAEYWVVNLVDSLVEVYGDPRNGRYQSNHLAGRDEALPLPGGLTGRIPVREILGPRAPRTNEE